MKTKQKKKMKIQRNEKCVKAKKERPSGKICETAQTLSTRRRALEFCFSLVLTGIILKG